MLIRQNSHGATRPEKLNRTKKALSASEQEKTFPRSLRLNRLVDIRITQALVHGATRAAKQARRNLSEQFPVSQMT
jgi:hypothetical protein